MPGERWTEEEVHALIQQVIVERRSENEIVVPGRSQAAINNQRRRLRSSGAMANFPPPRHLQPWTMKELCRLRELTGRGYTARLIARRQLLPGRSKDSISKMMGRHGLGNPERKARAQQAARLSHSQRNSLEQYLRDQGRHVPATDVARASGLSPKTINGWRRRLGVPLSWHEAHMTPGRSAYQR